MVQEERSKLGLVQASCAEVISRRPVAKEGADTAAAGGEKIRGDAVDGVHCSQVRFSTLSPLVQNWTATGPAPSSREILAGGGNVLLQTQLARSRPLLCCQIAAVRPAVPLLSLLQGELRTCGARILSVGRPGAGGEHTAPSSRHASPVAEPS